MQVKQVPFQKLVHDIEMVLNKDSHESAVNFEPFLKDTIRSKTSVESAKRSVNIFHRGVGMLDFQEKGRA